MVYRVLLEFYLLVDSVAGFCDDSDGHWVCWCLG